MRLHVYRVGNEYYASITNAILDIPAWATIIFSIPAQGNESVAELRKRVREMVRAQNISFVKNLDDVKDEG